jgi:type IV pilus assembly protein PilO
MAAASPALARLPLIAKLGVSVGILALTAAAYWIVFYGDIHSRIEAEIGKEQGLRNDLANARKAEFKYQQDLKELAEREQKQRDLEKVLPTKTEHPAFLSSLQSVANVTGVTLSAWSPQSEVVEKYYVRIPMRLELEGRFHQIAKFIYGVGQLDRIINIENISITDPKHREEEIFVKVSGLATAFRTVQSSEGKTSKVSKRNQRGKKKKK